MIRDTYLAVDPSWFDGYAARMSAAMNQPHATIPVGKGMAVPDVLTGVSGDTARLRISGIMTADVPTPEEVFYGEFGTAYPHIIEAIRAADEQLSANIGDSGGHVIVDMDTPGGEVRGIEAVHSAFASVAQRRSVEFVNHGMMTSGGAWIASAGTRITSMGEASMFGSIGVIVNTLDVTGMLEKFGVKRVSITNTVGTEKAPDIATDEGKEAIRKRLDDIYSVFRDRVTASGKINAAQVDALRGSVVLTRAAIAIGLADSVWSDQPPAMDAGNTQETHIMATLKEIIASDPAIAAEVESLKAQAFEAGAEQEKAAVKARIERAKPFLANPTYGQKVSEVATRVVAGELSPESLETTVAVLDAQREQAESEKAKAATVAIGATAAEPPELAPAKTLATENEAIASALGMR
jgi:ClpP class serine protease